MLILKHSENGSTLRITRWSTRAPLLVRATCPLGETRAVRLLTTASQLAGERGARPSD